MPGLGIGMKHFAFLGLALCALCWRYSYMILYETLSSYFLGLLRNTTVTPILFLVLALLEQRDG